jgi:hypothetical protein
VAVGSYNNTAGYGVLNPLIETLSGGTWTATTAPTSGLSPAFAANVGLDAISCPATGSCVVVGGYLDASNNQLALIETLSSSGWAGSTAPLSGLSPAAAISPGAPLGLLHVSCPATGSCVAVGLYQDTSGNVQGLIETQGPSTPTITGFTPTSGAVGTSVTITGTGFTGATAVSFNGTSASFTVNSGRQIVATVPSGATTGPISVTTPGGTGTSSASFTVTAATGPANTGALTMGYWKNKNGQGIIAKYCAGTSGTSLYAYLTGYNPFQDLTSSSCGSSPALGSNTASGVAGYVYTVIKNAKASGASMNAMLKAQMLATGLDVYFSDPKLGGNKINAPAPIGGVKINLTRICQMIDSSTGTATCSGTYENASGAFGGASSKTISDMLAYAASQSNSGGSMWYGNVKATQQLAKDAFDAINNQVAFAA